MAKGRTGSLVTPKAVPATTKEENRCLKVSMMERRVSSVPWSPRRTAYSKTSHLFRRRLRTRSVLRRIRSVSAVMGPTTAPRGAPQWSTRPLHGPRPRSERHLLPDKVHVTESPRLCGEWLPCLLIRERKVGQTTVTILFLIPITLTIKGQRSRTAKIGS